jgi:hypothetical protein
MSDSVDVLAKVSDAARREIVLDWFRSAGQSSLEPVMRALEASLEAAGFVQVSREALEGVKLTPKKNSAFLDLKGSWQHPEGGLPFHGVVRLYVELAAERFGRTHLEFSLYDETPSLSSTEAALLGRPALASAEQGLSFKDLLRRDGHMPSWRDWSAETQSGAMRELLGVYVTSYIRAGHSKPIAWLLAQLSEQVAA